MPGRDRTLRAHAEKEPRLASRGYERGRSVPRRVVGFFESLAGFSAPSRVVFYSMLMVFLRASAALGSRTSSTPLTKVALLLLTSRWWARRRVRLTVP